MKPTAVVITLVLSGCGVDLAHTECSHQAECGFGPDGGVEACVNERKSRFALADCASNERDVPGVTARLDRAYEQLVDCELRVPCTDYAHVRELCAQQFEAFDCAWAGCAGLDCGGGPRCASPDTPIATPAGERRIDDLHPGDLVFSVQHAAFVVVPIETIRRIPVRQHRVLEVQLANGRSFQMSAGHPLLDGSPLSSLQPGDELGGVMVVSVRDRAFTHAYTVDILPRSQTGAYVAAGALVGSTLARDRF